MAPPGLGAAGPAASLLIVAGEASGDQLGAALVTALRVCHPGLQVYGVGGAQMRAVGVETLFDIQALNTVGALEIGSKILYALHMARRLCREAVRRQTRVAVLIDAPGFNLALARQVKHAGLRVIGYVSPQIWAWRQGRIRKIARRIDKMLTLFRFEVPLYTQAGVAAEYVGHPLIDRLQHLPSPSQAAAGLGLQAGRPVVALLPGSRRQEIQRLLVPMLEAFQQIRQRLPQVQGVVPVAHTVSFQHIAHVVRHCTTDVTVVPEQSAQALCAADFALVASGTATLEAGFIGTPMVVVYKVHPVTALLARCLIRVPYIGLVNIVAQRQVVPELIQQQVQPRRLAAYALQCLEQPGEAQRVRGDLSCLRHLLGPGNSAHRAAVSISHFLQVAGK
ncbi:Lipid-A-disaccharide synthase [Candidatus Entotheonellaceae bacterium PAL068K]